ncbi:hypothetical protein RI129_009375 [Pyrocoelia pectoralis]|uniref:Uncharacterized protein n=1 Tax=Pyrocoelia pectoralis TaxID=417401 RepID=A0AAN7V5Y4_9COLE
MHATFWYLVLSCVFLQTLSTEIPKHFEDERYAECAKEVKIDKSVLEHLLDENYYIVNQDPLVPAYFECVFKKMSFIKDGKFDKDVIVKYLEEKVVPFLKPNDKNPGKTATDAFETCSTLEDEDLGKRIVKYSNCITKELK